MQTQVGLDPKNSRYRSAGIYHDTRRTRSLLARPGESEVGVYYSHADPWVIVPKHSKLMGSTINFASPSAIPVVLLTFAILVVPVLFVRTWDARIGAVLDTIPDQHCRVVSALRVLIFN